MLEQETLESAADSADGSGGQTRSSERESLYPLRRQLCGAAVAGALTSAPSARVLSPPSATVARAVTRW